MKRSGSIGLIVMGAAAFSASYAGGHAYLAWQRPSQPPSCVTRPDGTQDCARPRSSSLRSYVHYPFFSSQPAATTAGAVDQTLGRRALVAPSNGPDGAARRGFGSTAHMVAHASAGG